MNLRFAWIMVTLVVLLTACSTTHTTISAAQAGNVGDGVELAEAVVASEPQEILRDLQQNLLRFTVCDRSGACMRVDSIASGSQRERAAAGTWVPVGQFIELRGGRLMDDEGVLYIRANIVSHIPAPENWPEE